MTEQKPSLRDFTVYFFRLGSLGFGGPVVLSAHMHRDLVERRKWVSQEDYDRGLALAQLAPGPLAAQLAICLGWSHSGVWGATVVAFAFIVPSFLIVLALAAAYVKYSGLNWIQGAFYGIGAAVIAIMAQGAFKLLKKTVGKDRLYWALAVATAVVTAVTEQELVSVVIGSGIIALIVKGRWKDLPKGNVSALIPAWLLTGLAAPASLGLLATIFWFFAEAGAFVFGSGLAIVPFLRGGVVEKMHWLNDRQFLDAVAVAMITPGPVVIAVAFIGFLVAGLAGASAAALGVFLPCYLFVVIPAPYFRKYSEIPHIKNFVAGVTASAVGAIAGAAFVLGRRAIYDVPTAAIFVAALTVLLRVKKIPEPLLIAAAGLIGLAIH